MGGLSAVSYAMHHPCYAGAPVLSAGLTPAVRLVTRPLEMQLTDVASAAASEATGGQWSGMLGLPDDRLPELPPDGA